MKDQLISYVNLLFAGNPEAAEIRQEILQNTLDRYDDLVAQGKTPEAAYSLSIAGIGDVSELLQEASGDRPALMQESRPISGTGEPESRKWMRAAAVGLYIACAVPLFFFHDAVGVGILLLMVAAATVLLILAGKDRKAPAEEQSAPERKLLRSIHAAVIAAGLAVYFILSFYTGAWHLTWLVFPIIGAINGLITAVMDLKKEK